MYKYYIQINNKKSTKLSFDFLKELHKSEKNHNH